MKSQEFINLKCLRPLEIFGQHVYFCMSLILLFLTLSFPHFAKAGGDHSGGGKGFYCKESDNDYVYLADTYDLMKSGKYNDLLFVLPKSVVSAAAEYLDTKFPKVKYPHPYVKNQTVSMGWMITSLATHLHFKPLLYSEKIPKIEDDHIKNVPENCQKITLARQNLNKKSIEFNAFSQYLSPLEYGLLVVHEVLLALRGTPGDTTPIRNQVAEMLENSSLFRQRLKEYLNKFYDAAKKGKGYERSMEMAKKLKEDCESQDKNTQDCYRLGKLADGQVVDMPILPTLKEIPKVLQCRRTYGQQGTGSESGLISFTLTRTKGNGIPSTSLDSQEGWMSLYSFSPDQRAASVGDLPKEVEAKLTTSGGAYDNQDGIEDFGKMHIQFQWNSDSRNGVIHLDHYTPSTNEFTGSFSVRRKQEKLSDNPRDYYSLTKDFHLSFGVACHPANSDLSFEVDLLNSHINLAK